MEELGKTTEAYQQHRSQSHTQLASLQNRLELSQRNESSATTSLNALKTSHSSLETRLMDTMAKNAELSSKLVESQSAFKADMDASKRLSETLKKRDEQAQLRLEAVDQEWKQAREDMQKREDELIKQAEDERQRADQIQRKMDDLSRLVDTRYSAAPEADESSILPDASTTTGLPLTPNRSSNADLTAPTQSFLLSPAASLASRAQRASGAALSANKSYSELYTSYISSQAELTSAQTECRRLSDCLAGVLQDLEDRAPLLAEQRVQVQQLREQQEQSGKDLAQTMDQRDHEARRAESLRLDLEACQTENGLMASQLRDMGRQMRELLRTLASYEDDGMMDREPDFDPEVYESQAVEEVDTQAVISSQLVTYTSVSEMQRQNTTLLRLTREMGARMDEQDRQLRQRLDEDGDASVAEAHQLVSQMRQQLAELKSKVDSSEKERNMLQRALANGGHQLNSSEAASSSQEADRSVAQHYPLVTSDVQASFDAYKAETSSDIRQLKNDLTAAHKAQQTAESKAARRKAELEFAQGVLLVLHSLSV